VNLLSSSFLSHSSSSPLLPSFPKGGGCDDLLVLGAPDPGGAQHPSGPSEQLCRHDPLPHGLLLPLQHRTQVRTPPTYGYLSVGGRKVYLSSLRSPMLLAEY
jgi:hypothetical protein